ncbi:MAG: hypothetical protein JWM34_3804 [Ilumatobacteraceae bacterium]|nr:hypothetical protein [Ilumatobacteraceae bacterium]
MTETADRYRRLADRFTALVAAVPADRWGAPSPCDEWTAQGVLDHVVSTEAGMFARMPFATDLGIDGVAAIDAWPTVRDAVQGALDDPARADQEYDGMFGTTTFAKTIDQFFCLDLVVHAWDLARAAGVEEFEAMPTDEIDAVTRALEPIADSMRMPGVFGPEVPVADDADPQTRLLATVGRRA